MVPRQRAADDALDVLARTRGRALIGYAFLLTGDLRDAEDLVQDAMIRTFSRHRPIAPGAVEGYVRQAILNAYIDGYRRRRLWSGVRHLLVRDDSESADDPSDRLDLLAALRRLPPQQRACVVLHFCDDLTVAQVAERLALGVGTVKRYIHLAVRRMEGLLEPPEATGPDEGPAEVLWVKEEGSR